MLKIAIQGLTLVGIVVLSVACVKNNGKSPDPDSPTRVTQLTVPASFDWQMAHAITTQITAPRQTLVTIGENEQSDPMASFLVGADNEPVELTIPNSLTAVWVGYTRADGSKAGTFVSAVGSTLIYTVPDDCQLSEVVESAAGASTKAPVNQDQLWAAYPQNGMGTLMFEDLWPSYGDYDFNDLVANYRVKVYLQNQNKVRYFTVTVRIQAVGGTLPYELYFALAGEAGANVREQWSAILAKENADPAVSLELVRAGDGTAPAIFRFNNVKKNPNVPSTQIYVNTKHGAELAASKLTTVTFRVVLQTPMYPSALSLNKFDFFLARTDPDNKEIHQGGAAPVLFGRTQYEAFSLSSSLTQASTKDYYSIYNMVWGINIPAVIPHAYEKCDFLAAYPNFKSWVQSGGTTNKDWYTTASGNRIDSNLVPIQ